VVRKTLSTTISVTLTAVCAATAAAQTAPDRTVLPIREPKRPVYKELDARNAKMPPRFATSSCLALLAFSEAWVGLAKISSINVVSTINLNIIFLPPM
jgi:hypothetical protein